MPTTTNYGWTMPTPGGSAGVWGPILNTLFQAIDTKVKAVETAAAAGGAPPARRMNAALEAVIMNVGSGAAGFARGSNGNLVWQPQGFADICEFRIPLRDLRPGQVIDSFESQGGSFNGAITSVDLYYVTDALLTFPTVVSTGHLVGSSAGTVTTSGVGHTVLADAMYYLRCRPAIIGTPGSEVVSLSSFKVTVA